MSTISVIALRSFPWSEDGYTEKHAAEKQVFDLPERLFDGLNKAGYVRRAVIGDGHVALRNEAVAAANLLKTAEAAARLKIGLEIDDSGALRPVVEGDGAAPADVPTKRATPASEADATSSAIDDSVEAPAAEAGAPAAQAAAPRPAGATAPLSDDEIAGLKDGSWKDWRFFTKRSVAAKLSTAPMNSAEDVIPVLEAKAAELAGE